VVGASLQSASRKFGKRHAKRICRQRRRPEPKSCREFAHCSPPERTAFPDRGRAQWDGGHYSPRRRGVERCSGSAGTQKFQIFWRSRVNCRMFQSDLQPQCSTRARRGRRRFLSRWIVSMVFGGAAVTSFCAGRRNESVDRPDGIMIKINHGPGLHRLYGVPFSEPSPCHLANH